jgi:hypothetical protein
LDESRGAGDEHEAKENMRLLILGIMLRVLRFGSFFWIRPPLERVCRNQNSEATVVYIANKAYQSCNEFRELK